VQELQSIAIKFIERHGAPEFTKCNKPLRGYHGTSKENAISIMSEGFTVGYGRAGRGVYFFEGENEKNVIEAAKIHAAGRLRAMGSREMPAVVRAEIHVQNFLDLGSKGNYFFLRRMQKQLEKYAYKYRPTEIRSILHEHTVGKLVQDAVGHVKCLGSFGAIRSYFAYEKSGSAEKGLVVFNPADIVKIQLL
jgi:hypothetical protein